ncbi:MAG TPA: hypothetical protein PLH86_00895, partial [Saprospiraceae bacterium]|nr:hypothetical protein [Saprospiraceae bacterium]
NQEYDPTTDTWATKANMPTNNGFSTASVVNNKIYVIGGYDGRYIVSINIEYNPITKMVRGNVQASYIIDLFPLGIKQDLTSPDTIVIRDFQFETKILER